MIRQTGQPIHNYDTSVIIPFNKTCFPDDGPEDRVPAFFVKNGVEVVLVVHEKEAELALKLTNRYLYVNWKIITIHNLLNFSACINAALPHCERKYLFIVEPELLLVSDCLHLLREMTIFYVNYFFVCAVTDQPVIIDDSERSVIPGYSFGPLFLLKEQLTAVDGFDTAINDTQLAKLNVQARLQQHGYELMHVPEAICSYRNTPAMLSMTCLKHWYFNCKPPSKTHERSQIIYHWAKKPDLIKPLEAYLGNFAAHAIRSKNILKKEYKAILLAQCYNEQKHIKGFLDNMKNYFDGIIFLDDGSTDNSYELAQHEKLIIKVKKNRIRFDDIENRNILLQIAAYVNTEWLCFMDLDERFDERFCDFSEFINRQDIKTVIFNFVHTWKGANLYNASYRSSDNGFNIRFRMFRNIGRMQIASDKRLHFPSVPYFDEKYNSKILFRHLGNSTKKLREKKYQFYSKDDDERDLTFYKNLIDDKAIKLLPVKSIIYKNRKFTNTRQ